MSAGGPIYPPIEIEFLKLLKELQPIFVKALNSLGGKKPSDAGTSYLGRIAVTVNRAADGYLCLRESGRMDASKLLVRPALEAVFCGTAAIKNKKFLFRKAYSEWEEDKKFFAKDAAGKKDADEYPKQLQVQFRKHNPAYPVSLKIISVRDAAEMAELLPVYEYAYRIYCKYTHSAMRAVSGNLDHGTDLHDTPTIVWCVLFTLTQLKQYTPAEIPDLAAFNQKLELLTGQLSKYPPTTRVNVSLKP
jgi:Family of unknown function (DUF5677)